METGNTMTIYFVRHGQTDWNKALRWQGGAADIELNQTGRAQAESVAGYFTKNAIRPVAVISSPMKRAMYTAGCIAAALDQDVLVEPAFRELALGAFEGKTTQELQAEYGEQFDRWLSRYHLDASPGGENLEQAIIRMFPALKSHIAQLHGGAIIIVAHQAILMAMKAALSGNIELEALATYKQANHEIDIWDLKRAACVERVDITA